jgi:hypothetical protein
MLVKRKLARSPPIMNQHSMSYNSVSCKIALRKCNDFGAPYSAAERRESARLDAENSAAEGGESAYTLFESIE